jgi:hypothetical protein
LIDFLCPLIRKSSFQVLSKKSFLACVMIISRFFLIVEAFIGVPDRSSLRICGWRLKGLWIGCDFGGRLTISKVLLASSSLKSLRL